MLWYTCNQSFVQMCWLIDLCLKQAMWPMTLLYCLFNCLVYCIFHFYHMLTVYVIFILHYNSDTYSKAFVIVYGEGYFAPPPFFSITSFQKQFYTNLWWIHSLNSRQERSDVGVFSQNEQWILLTGKTCLYIKDRVRFPFLIESGSWTINYRKMWWKAESQNTKWA